MGSHPGGGEFSDLGFGSKVALQERRLLNRDGSFNVRRKGLSFFRSLTLYHHLVTMPWGRFLLILFSTFLVFNILFASAYVLCGPGALQGSVALTVPDRLMEAFFFSVQTATTIGYGHLIPVGVFPNVLQALESMTGLLGFALATSLLFARFSRPTAQILFSDNAVLAPYLGITALEFRMINERSNQLINVELDVTLSRTEHSGGITARKFYPLALERDQVTFFPLSLTVVHPITEASPLFGVSREEFIKSDPEVFVLITAIEETFSQTVHARASYKGEELIWGARFVNILERSDDGVISVDLQRIHQTEPANLPTAERAGPAPDPQTVAALRASSSP